MSDQRKETIQSAEREAFEKVLASNPDTRFWNTTDAMLWAWQARAALAQAVPHLLPEHETEAMHNAVMAVMYQGVTRTNTDALWQAYRRALLNAAPTPPAQPEPPQGNLRAVIDPELLERIRVGGARRGDLDMLINHFAGRGLDVAEAERAHGITEATEAERANVQSTGGHPMTWLKSLATALLSIVWAIWTLASGAIKQVRRKWNRRFQR